MSDPTRLAPPDADVEQGSSSDHDEITPLLLRTQTPTRPSYRKRRLTASSIIPPETYRRRWWTGVAGGAVALSLLVVGGGVVALRTHQSHKGDKPNDTPDFSKLPAPQPGLRNPNYLVSGQYGGVATEVGVCSDIGVDVLREGGTATDAAIASALCIGVTNSFSAGIGGGGFMIIRPSTSHKNLNPRCTKPFSIDFRETAPSAADAYMYAPRKDDPTFDSARASKVGGLSIGVPGELRGLEAAYKMCGGGLPWARLVQPSADLARESDIGPEMARRLSIPALSAWMLEKKVWRDQFAPDGELLKVGETLRRPAYARTLEKIGKQGAGAFYEGPIADSMIRTIRKEGGIMTSEDLAGYKAIVLPALEATYLGRKYYVGHAPSGGPVLINLLNTLEGYNTFATGGRTGLAIHRFVEALKCSIKLLIFFPVSNTDTRFPLVAFGARTEIGDPAFIDNAKRVHEITTKDYADAVRHNITDNETHEIGYYKPRFAVEEDHGTTHLSVIDKFGSAVSLTSTVNLIFGSRVMDPETGIILNDEMDDFATPGIPDAFGLLPSPFNFPAGGKRPLSSTVPLIMDGLDGEVYLATGGSGGSRIFGAVAQVILNLDWGFDLGNAVEQPRVHHQLSPAYVSIESGFRPDLIEALASRGHNVSMFDVNVGIAEVQAVLRQPSGKIFATSDSRKNGIPAAY
ncbi:hypothetical protein P7C70_g1271, partial [Phenoliferia sp. Uapishka_3]